MAGFNLRDFVNNHHRGRSSRVDPAALHPYSHHPHLLEGGPANLGRIQRIVDIREVSPTASAGEAQSLEQAQMNLIEFEGHVSNAKGVVELEVLEEVKVGESGKFRRKIGSWLRGHLLGIGSFATVYEGISDDGFFFAVKEISLLDEGSKAQERITQLEHEIALLSHFEHENIVQYLGTDKEETKVYIFLELATQGSLASLYQKYSLKDSQVSSYTRQILTGLKYLHSQNVMHRDIKCANILVDASGSVKLSDFGLAKETSELYGMRSCRGSAYWMAPEVVNPQLTYGLEADIWSLGCTVLELLTRQHPYPNLEWQEALCKILRGEPPRIPDSLSLNARDFIQICLRVKPGDRPSAAELLNHPFVRSKRPAPGSVFPG